MAIGAVVATAAPAPRLAEACGNAVILQTDASVRAIKEAGEKLDDGSPREAAAIVEKTIENVEMARVNVVTTNKWLLLVNRGLRVYALAAARTGGALGPVPATKPELRKQNVDWATAILKGLTAVKPNDAAARTDYGEVLATSKPSEAKAILEELAQKDVLATPYAYAALARLRDAEGDAAGRDEALAKCRTMASNKSVCGAPAAAPAP